MQNETLKINPKYGPWAMIIGASEGIGRSFAEQLAAARINLILVARRQDALDQAAAEIRARHAIEVDVHVADMAALGLEGQLDRIIGGRDIGLLIYNAGAVHGANSFLDDPLDKALGLVKLNCISPLTLIHRLGRSMRARGGGGVILMSSLSALAGSPYVATYAATKSFDLILGEGLWGEMSADNIDVLCLIAGATMTPSMERSGMRFSPPGTPPGPGTFIPMASGDVAREGLENLGRHPVWVAGEGNRQAAEGIRQAPRDAAIQGMGSAAAGLYGKPWPMVGQSSR
ncbi:MAG: SDR family NAD(P)-dependent oxidoreductase [Proteobacteria bacterium]|nr:SDR family NAD(P)-dependent oxidoreductase [Pseudomonadota bacterium]HQR04410.1 SDR family NAD(P)-dependent oxidoreductase [Rhodocyclaceae bacterium]